MRKIVVNFCYGGFSVSKEAAKFMAKRGNAIAIAELEIADKKRREWYGNSDYPRDDEDLVAAVETLGTDASSGDCSRLVVVEIPEDVHWHIEEYDGMEHVAENHRTWFPKE